MLCVGLNLSSQCVVFRETYLQIRDVGRTINGATYTDTQNMTDENCISYCSSKGFQYAGTEYSQECCMYSPKPSTLRASPRTCGILTRYEC